METKRSDYPSAIRRAIRNKEKYLKRNCWKIWEFTSADGVTHLFGNFSCGRGDTIQVTIASKFPDDILRFWYIQY